MDARTAKTAYHVCERSDDVGGVKMATPAAEEKFCKAATVEPYSFLYVKLTAKTPDDMFYESLSKPINVTDASSLCVSK